MCPPCHVGRAWQHSSKKGHILRCTPFCATWPSSPPAPLVPSIKRLHAPWPSPPPSLRVLKQNLFQLRSLRLTYSPSLSASSLRHPLHAIPPNSHLLVFQFLDASLRLPRKHPRYLTTTKPACDFYKQSCKLRPLTEAMDRTHRCEMDSFSQPDCVPSESLARNGPFHLHLMQRQLELGNNLSQPIARHDMPKTKAPTASDPAAVSPRKRPRRAASRSSLQESSGPCC